MDILLASNSPRRRELLSLTGWHFVVHPVEVDEQPLPDEQGDAYVLRLSEVKARAAAAKSDKARIVVAADTTVVEQGEILGKPQDHNEALIMLHRLRGSVHQVYTAVTVLDQTTEKLHSDVCCTDVPMRCYSDEEMQAYIASGDPLDKAGAYAIQHAGFHPVEDLRGCFANVMGLPLCHLVRILREYGSYPLQDVPQTCQEYLAYSCPVYEDIL